MIVVGFTGTRRGMTDAQKDRLRAGLIKCGATHFVHGGCVGADAEAHAIAIEMGLDVTVRPSMYAGLRAPCEGATLVHKPTDALVRNRQIVADAMIVVAAPAEYNGVMRSGTWYTIRHAKRAGKLAYVIHPDGNVVVGGYVPRLNSSRSTVKVRGGAPFSHVIKPATIVI